MLGDLLNQDSRVVWRGEVLERYSRAAENEGVGDSHSGARRLIRGAERKSGRHIHGFEMKYWHLVRLHIAPEWMIDHLNRRGYRHILLERRNLLRVYVSGSIMQGAGPAHLKVGEARRAAKIRIEPETALERMRAFGEFYRELRRRLPDALPLAYEDDILPDPRIGYRRVVESLGLLPEAVEVSYQRTNPGSLEDTVLNWEEVAVRLGDTEFAWMLEA